MARILEELYYENIDPNAKSFQAENCFHKAMQTVSDNEEKLLLLLTGKEKDLLIDLDNAQSEILGTTSLETFIEGFRLGARFRIGKAQQLLRRYLRIAVGLNFCARR